MTASLIRSRASHPRARSPPLGADRRRRGAAGGRRHRRGRHVRRSRQALPERAGDRHGNEIMLPGFVNGHHHVGLTPVQLGSPDMPLELWFATRMVGARPRPLSRHALFGLRDDRLGHHHRAAHPWLDAAARCTRCRRVRRRDPRLRGHRHAGVLLLRGARPEPPRLRGRRGIRRAACRPSCAARCGAGSRASAIAARRPLGTVRGPARASTTTSSRVSDPARARQPALVLRRRR